MKKLEESKKEHYIRCGHEYKYFSQTYKFREDLLNIIYSVGLFANLNEPTRYGNHSQTCIDHIFNNFISAQCKVMEPGSILLYNAIDDNSL